MWVGAVLLPTVTSKYAPKREGCHRGKYLNNKKAVRRFPEKRYGDLPVKEYEKASVSYGPTGGLSVPAG
jgi:hypothetical protein